VLASSGDALVAVWTMRPEPAGRRPQRGIALAILR
jgi:hypothetical protein